MSMRTISEIANKLKERLFRNATKQRLRTMKEHAELKERRAHGDFISQSQDVPEKSEHQHRIEHNAVNFWTYYFEGEEAPLHKPLPPHMRECAHDDEIIMKTQTISPQFSTVNPSEDGIGESFGAVERRWLQNYTLARLALDKRRLSEAVESFRTCLKESEKFKQPSRKKAVSAKGLAEALERQGNRTEADKYYAMALDIDEQLLGDGDRTLEDEFYKIALHLVDEGMWSDVETLYFDLVERLRMSVGRKDKMMARCFNELGVCYCRQKKLDTAEALFSRALQILESCDPLPRKQLAAVYNNYAALCEMSDRNEEGDNLYRKALAILDENDSRSVCEEAIEDGAITDRVVDVPLKTQSSAPTIEEGKGKSSGHKIEGGEEQSTVANQGARSPSKRQAVC